MPETYTIPAADCGCCLPAVEQLCNDCMAGISFPISAAGLYLTGFGNANCNNCANILNNGPFGLPPDPWKWLYFSEYNDQCSRHDWSYQNCGETWWGAQWARVVVSWDNINGIDYCVVYVFLIIGSHYYRGIHYGIGETHEWRLYSPTPIVMTPALPVAVPYYGVTLYNTSVLECNGEGSTANVCFV